MVVPFTVLQSGTNAVTLRLKSAEAEDLVYFWSVSPEVQGGGGGGGYI